MEYNNDLSPEEAQAIIDKNKANKDIAPIVNTPEEPTVEEE